MPVHHSASAKGRREKRSQGPTTRTDLFPVPEKFVQTTVDKRDLARRNSKWIQSVQICSVWGNKSLWRIKLVHKHMYIAYKCTIYIQYIYIIIYTYIMNIYIYIYSVYMCYWFKRPSILYQEFRLPWMWISVGNKNNSKLPVESKLFSGSKTDPILCLAKGYNWHGSCIRKKQL